MAEDLEAEIRNAALAPQEFHGDSGGARAVSVPDVIAADRYLAARRAVVNFVRSFTRIKLSPPGAD